jgi:hypothetical protein
MESTADQLNKTHPCHSVPSLPIRGQNPSFSVSFRALPWCPRFFVCFVYFVVVTDPFLWLRLRRSLGPSVVWSLR